MSNLESVIETVGEAKFRAALTRHFVGLGYTIRRIEDSDSVPRQYQSASGFLLSVKDTWFVITAGHVLSKVEELIAAGWRVKDWHIDDSAGWEQASRRIPPPFTFSDEDTIVGENSEGDDYAAIRVKDFHRRELEANGKVAIAESNWGSLKPPDVSALCIVGIPDEHVESLDTPGVFVVNKRIAYMEVTPLADPPEEYKKAQFSFYGKIANVLFDEEQGLGAESIRGMSGGPIFSVGVTDAGDFDYRLLALQSSWYRESRLVIGCPVRRFGQYLATLKA